MENYERLLRANDDRVRNNNVGVGNMLNPAQLYDRYAIPQPGVWGDEYEGRRYYNEDYNNLEVALRNPVQVRQHIRKPRRRESEITRQGGFDMMRQALPVRTFRTNGRMDRPYVDEPQDNDDQDDYGDYPGDDAPDFLERDVPIAFNQNVNLEDAFGPNEYFDNFDLNFDFDELLDVNQDGDEHARNMRLLGRDRPNENLEVANEPDLMEDFEFFDNDEDDFLRMMNQHGNDQDEDGFLEAVRALVPVVDVPQRINRKRRRMGGGEVGEDERSIRPNMNYEPYNRVRPWDGEDERNVRPNINYEPYSRVRPRDYESNSRNVYARVETLDLVPYRNENNSSTELVPYRNDNVVMDPVVYPDWAIANYTDATPRMSNYADAFRRVKRNRRRRRMHILPYSGSSIRRRWLEDQRFSND
jgi:hypothetical protein